jgi:hypothetical protein
MAPQLHVRAPAERAVLDGATALARSRAWDALTDQVRSGPASPLSAPAPDR